MLEYQGREYDVSAELFAALELVNRAKYGKNADKLSAEMVKSLAGFEKLTAKNEKQEAQERLEAELRSTQDAIEHDQAFTVWAQKAASKYAHLTNELAQHESVLGGKPTPKHNGAGYKISVPMGQFDLETFVQMFGECKFETILDTGNKSYSVFAQFENPDWDKIAVEWRNARQMALDAATVYTKSITNVSVRLDDAQGKIVLALPGTRSSSGERTSNGPAAPKGTRIWATDAQGNRYEGTNREVFDAMRAAGVQFASSAVPASIQNGQVSKKLVSTWGFLDA